MAKRWYVVHAYSGFENQVVRMLGERIQRSGLQDSFGEVLVPTEEVVVGRQILLAMGLLSGPRLVSCPTCGRCRVDLQPLARRVQEALREVETPLVVAVMGCEVNGPGEAKEADVGIAAGKDKVLLFRKGEALRTVPFAEAFDALMREVRMMNAE